MCAAWLLPLAWSSWATGPSCPSSPAPGEPAVSFAPGHNLANYIDLHYLPGRMNDKVWDPEGLLSTIPAIGTALLGVFTGLFLKRKDLTPMRKAHFSPPPASA